ncbi:MAG TPA: DNA polymerase I, partial [Bacteroidales bacterium]|nr:DNA polymerase I [Bacteroidales bacterium]
MSKKIFLLDAMALIYRSYYALSHNPRFTSGGLNTSAILGFANTLYDVIRNEKPTHIGVAFDTMAPTVRHIEFAAYKANRDAMPEAIASSLPYIRRLIEAFNIPILEFEGYEADDVIGTFAKKAEKSGFDVFIMSSDKDFGQLVSQNILQYKPAKPGEQPEVHGVSEVCERFGIEHPQQLTDILGLGGDASDNIPGIPGVGEVTAKKLIKEFGSVEKIIQNSNLIGNPGLRKKVEQYKEQALFSKQLATIITDVPIPYDEERLKLTPPDEPRLKGLLDELEFRTFARRVFSKPDSQPEPAKNQSFTTDSSLSLFSEVPDSFDVPTRLMATIDTTPHNYFLITTSEQRSELVKRLAVSNEFSFDTETTGVDVHQSELVCISFALEPHQAWCVMIPENYHEAASIVSEFKQLFENNAIAKVGQNLKFDISMLHYYDVSVRGKLFDTMLAHYLLRPDLRHNLDFMSQAYLRYEPIPITKLIGKRGSEQESMRKVKQELLKEYACEDADIAMRLKAVFEPKLDESECNILFETIEIPLVPVLASMEIEGVRLDVDLLKEYSVSLAAEISTVEDKIYDLSQCRFNIASPRQLGEVLFERLKISETPKQTKTKQFSTGEDVLTKLIHKHPIVSAILEYRSLTKLKSTYVDALPALVNRRTGKLHTSYNQAVTATGRLSSNNPNLQNIPIRTEKGREIRKAFVPRNDDYLLLSADYSQIELRIIASLSGDEHMIDDFNNGCDIHAATASRVYGVPLSEVSPQMRRNAKTVNFGIIYGISAFGLSERLNISRTEAATIIDQYFKKYQNIRKYMENQIAFAKKHGYVETIMKRRRYLSDINSANQAVRGFAERNAINAPIQGSAADMIKLAMINIFGELNRQNLNSKLILQVHDELVLDVYKPETDIV